MRQPRLGGGEALAFFYCSRTSGQTERKESREILRSIVKQLSSPVSGLPLKQPIISKYQENLSAGNPPATLALKESKRLITRLIQHEYQHVTLIIDALDECNRDTRRELLIFLVELVKLSGTIVKIFISSRNEPIFPMF
jgi:hypothetical protein